MPNKTPKKPSGFQSDWKKIRRRIEREADPLGFLMRLARGEAIKIGKEEVIPSLEHRLKANTILEKKIYEDIIPPSESQKPTEKSLEHLRSHLLQMVESIIQEKTLGRVSTPKS